MKTEEKEIKKLRATLVKMRTQKQLLPHININSWEEMAHLFQLIKQHPKKIAFLAITEKVVPSLGGYQIVGKTFQAWKKLYQVNNLYLHLDHSHTIANCQQAAVNGFESVMFAGAHLEIKKNIAQAKKLEQFIKNKNVLLELEIGKMKSDSYSKIEEIKLLTAKVQPDFLAIAIGNHHGYQQTNNSLNFNHLQKIQATTTIPLVLHGGSGIKWELLTESKKWGIAKVNYDSLFQKTFAQKLAEYFQNTSQQEEKWFWWNKISKFARKAVNQKITTVLNFCFQDEKKE